MLVDFWAKTVRDDQPGISVFDHMVNVGCVARCLAQIAPDLLEGFQIGAADGRDWFASAKRAILAPFGVGMVGRPLLGVVAVKDFFVRRYALAGKVVIVDEVHSFDVYTGTPIDRLISMADRLGCTLIVLCATLTGERRNQIVVSTSEHGAEDAMPYPPIMASKTREESQSL